MDAARAEDRAVRPHRRRAEPAVPIQARFHFLLGQVARLARGTDIDVHRLQLADAAAADQFAGLAESVFRALLAAGLEDAVVLADRVDHQLGLTDGEGERLLAVNVLAGFARFDRDD